MTTTFAVRLRMSLPNNSMQKRDGGIHMPYVWTDPAIFIVHNSVTIYHSYKNDFAEEGMRENWFTTDICGGDCDDPCAFDVRDLSTYAADIPYEQIICEAIDKGELKKETPLKELEA